MKIMNKLNILSLGIILVMTVSVQAVGMVVINDILYGFHGRVLRLELRNAQQAVVQKLNRAGMLAAARTAADLESDLRQKEGLKSARLFIVAQPDNRVVYHPDLPAGDRAPFGFIDDMFRRREGSIEYTFKGVSHYAVFTTISPLKWLVGLSLTKAEMLEKKRDFLLAIGGITFLVLCINALLVRFFGKRLVHRIRTALDCVKRIEEGDLSARIPPTTVRDEVGHLQAGINAMSASIRQRTMERQVAEEALRKSRALLQSIIDNSTAIIYVKDLEGRYLLINRRFEELFHVTREAVPGKTDFDLFPKFRADAYRGFDQRVLAAGTAMEAEEVAPQDDGLHTYISIKAPLYDEADHPYAVCGVSTDITERKRAEEALRKAHEELEQRVIERTKELSEANVKLQEMDHFKSMFIASMSHELRTPLNSVIGFSSILLNEWVGPLNEEQKENLALILRSGKHLLALINDVIDVSKIETGKIESLIEEFDIYDLIAEAVNLTVRDAQGKGLELKVEAIHLTVNTDRRRLLQCVINLLSNAVKFTERGSVRVNVRRVNDVGAPVTLPPSVDRNFVDISVEDTGIGLQEQEMPKLFQPFVRIVSSYKVIVPGTGLGLYLTKRLATEVLKGDIMCESAYGRGSIFTLRIPVMIK